MIALVEPDIEECYLLAILDSPDGIDLGEFAVHDPRNDDGCYRLYDFQWRWWSCRDTYQIDQGARSCGKTEGIKLRALAFPFYRPGAGMLISAPELNHLRPLTDEIEKMLLNTRIVREMLPAVKSAGIARQPHWQVRFKNGSSIISRLPNKDGRGVKGQHVDELHIDEAQDFNAYGWREIVETLNTGAPDAMWRCIAADQLVLTRNGWVPIQDVEVGQQVWTHRQRWRPVLCVFDNGVRECVSVGGQGHFGLETTPDHKIWVAESFVIHEGGRRIRKLGQPVWQAIGQAAGARWASPRWVADTAAIPPVSSSRVRRHGALDATNPEWLWLYGHYLAEGYAYQGRTHWCTNRGLADEIAARLTAIGIACHRYEQGESVKVVATRREVAEWMSANAGRGARGKQLAPWVLGLDGVQRCAIFEGMMAGDGFWSDSRQRWEYVTVSKALACGMKLLAQSLGHTANLRRTAAHPSVIEGRTVQTGICYTIQVTPVRPRGQSLLDDTHVWASIRESDIAPIGPRSVFDLEVAEDHSFVVEGIVVSNCHGVSRGVRDAFFEKSQPGSGWKVHRPMAMNRPSWSKEERDAKIVEYGGSRQSVDYRRNIYGEHGDASNSVFVLAKLMACVDLDEGSVYNQDVYSCTKIQFERFPRGSSDSERMAMLHGWIEIPGEHFHGYSQRVDKNREVGAPRGYSAYWGGMDVGVTNHPSEILIFGQRSGTEELELLTRVQMHRVNTDDQMVVVERLFEIYGGKLRLGIDKTGVGFPLWDQLTRRPSFGERIFGFGFSEKRLAAIEDRPLQTGETIKDLAIMRNVVETATDLLRNDYVDTKRLRLPYDREVLIEFQGQSYNVVRDNGDPYGVRRQYTGGSFHCVDESTEIMTSGGWRRYDQVEVGDDVLTMDVTTGCSRWSPIEALNIQSGPPIMIRSKSNAHDSLTTGSHRWPVRLYDGRTGTFGPLKWKTTATLSGGDGVPVAVPYGGAPAEAVYSDAFVELMAWYWTEGNCTKSNTVISQSSISEDNVERIRKALTEEFGPAGYMPEGFWHEYWSGTTCYFMLSMRVGCLLRSLAPDCNVRPEFLLALTAGQLDLFIRTSERGDGNHHPNSTRRAFQHQRDRQKTDALEMACALAGIATSTRVYERPTSRSGVSITVALLDKRFVRPANFRVEEPYSGDVWCPTTRDGTWLARRSGTVYWTGNSLDAAKVAVATKHIPPLEALLETRPVRGAVFDVFMGA